MTLKRLFLAHYHGDAQEIAQLAKMLRLHGIVPWVDKDGGFAVADDAELEARRAIREDCFGLLLYASADAFTRPFIREVEIDEAWKARQANPSFALLAVPRRINFADLGQLSIQNFGFDLSRYHTVAIPDGSDLDESCAKVAEHVLDRVVRRGTPNDRLRLSMQYSTREVFPDHPDDVLRIDATSLYRPGVDCSERSRLLLRGLTSVKKAIANASGRPRLSIHGSKHLSAAFAFGRVFAPFSMDIHQTPDSVWRTDIQVPTDLPLSATVKEVDSTQHRLFVEVAAGYKNIDEGVNAFIASTQECPAVRLTVKPLNGAIDLDNGACLAMAMRVYTEIERVLQHNLISEIYLFAAVPQSLMIMLGQRFKGMPPVLSYEWDGSHYLPGCWIPGGVL